MTHTTEILRQWDRLRPAMAKPSSSTRSGPNTSTAGSG